MSTPLVDKSQSVCLHETRTMQLRRIPQVLTVGGKALGIPALRWLELSL
jgi:hypothetical protein